MGDSIDKHFFQKIPDYIIIIGIFIVSLILRTACLYQIHGSAFNPLSLDAEYYNSWALGISKGDIIGKEIFYGLPLYPYFLGLIYYIFGHSVFIAQIFNAALDSLSCALLYLIGKKVFNKNIGLLAALIFIFYNMSLYSEAFLEPTALSIFLSLSIVSILLSIFKNPTFIKWVLAGLMIGIMALANASIILFVPFIVIWAFMTFKPVRARLLINILSMIIAILSVISVTAVRNYMVGKDIVPITYHAGITFYAGNNPQSIGSFNLPYTLGRGVTSTKVASRDIAEKALGRKLKPSEISGYWFGQAFSFIKNEQGRYLKLLFNKIYLFWWVRPIPEGLPLKIIKEYSSILRLPLFGYALISPLSILGLVISYRRGRRDLATLYLFLCSILLSTTIYFVNSRYRMLAAPVLILFAAATISFFYNSIKERKYFYSVLIPICALFLFAVLNANFAAYREDVVYNQLGVSYAMKGKFPEAESAFKKALEMNFSNPMAHYNLGTLYLNQKKYKEALKELSRAIEFNPGYSDAHNNAGTIYNLLGDREKAIYHFEYSLRINPNQEEIKKALDFLKKQRI